MVSPDENSASPKRPEEVASSRENPRDAAILHWMQQLAPHGIFTTDNHLRIQSWNHWLETHSGLTVAAVLGKPLLEVFPDLMGRKLDKFLNVFRSDDAADSLGSDTAAKLAEAAATTGNSRLDQC